MRHRHCCSHCLFDTGVSPRSVDRNARKVVQWWKLVRTRQHCIKFKYLGVGGALDDWQFRLRYVTIDIAMIRISQGPSWLYQFLHYCWEFIGRSLEITTIQLASSAGKLCVEATPTAKMAWISEELCIGCGICVKVNFLSCKIYSFCLAALSVVQANSKFDGRTWRVQLRLDVSKHHPAYIWKPKTTDLVLSPTYVGKHLPHLSAVQSHKICCGSISCPATKLSPYLRSFCTWTLPGK